MNEGQVPGQQATIRDALDAQGEDPLVCAEGTVERIVFESQDSGFIVARLQEPGKPYFTTFVGNGLAISPGETIRLWGRCVDDKRFGRQIRVEKYQTIMPATAAAIEKYLGSGLIDGIGPVFAKRLVDAFGVETLRIIDEDPKRLRTVDGIGRKRADQIRTAWEAQKAIQSIMLFLQGHGIGAAQAVKIYKRYGDSAVAVLRDNPYRLADDIAGIAFKSADAIASRLGIEKDSPKRAVAGVLHVLGESVMEGHAFASDKALLRTAMELLGVSERIVEDAMTVLEREQRVIREDDRIYTPDLHAAETGCAHLIKRLLKIPHEPVPIVIERAIAWVQKEFKIELSEEQRQAIQTAVNAKMMVITGGPGTGKTTLLNSLLAILAKKGLSLILAAPTGRAAKRMSDATGREAKTIHRLLEWSPKAGGFLRNEGNPLTADLVVIDGTSMVDIRLMFSLLNALSPQTRLFLVGDVDQLPSVGPGNVLMDVILSRRVPVVWLKTVFRQAAESGIISNAHRINSGQLPVYNEKDFFFIERKDPAKALETILELVTKRIPAKFKLDPARDIQVLAPMHRGDAGVARLNEELQHALNPSVQPVAHRPFGLHDKVMQMRNNYELDVFNGDIGFVTVVDEGLKEAQIQFEDRAVLYPFDNLDELSLAYAGTIHKSQGSEYPAVIVPLLAQHYMMLQRNVLYTAITRASRLVILVGDPKAVALAVHNTKTTKRNTRLADRLGN